MSLLFVSTFPPKQCGIAVYTKFLSDWIAAGFNKKIHIISEGDAYSRKGLFDIDILAAVAGISDAEIIHIQHAPDLFPDKKRFISLLKELSARGHRIFVTLHTVYDNKADRDFYKEINIYSHIIVHNSKCKEIIDDSSEKITVIAHGTEMILDLESYRDFDESAVRSKNDFVFLFLGFIHAQKNLHVASIAFSKLARKNRSVKFFVVGKPGGDKWYNKLYLFLCKALTFFSDRVVWKTGFVENDEIHQYLKAADVVLMPYLQSYSSSSGIFHLTIGAGKPFICSDSPKFSEIKEYVGKLPVFIPANNVKKWTDTMELLSKESKILDQISESVKEYAKTTSWNNIASRHIELYDKVK